VEYEQEEAARDLARQERADRAAVEPATDRNVTVRVSVDAINAAKALGTLSMMPYRQVLASAAQKGIDALVVQVQGKLNPDSEDGLAF
jgi:hypothetical protein